MLEFERRIGSSDFNGDDEPPLVRNDDPENEDEKEENRDESRGLDDVDGVAELSEPDAFEVLGLEGEGDEE